MIGLLQRLCEWNTMPLNDEPRNVLKEIITEAGDLLDGLEVSRYPEQVVKPLKAPSTEPTTASSEETSEPDKSPQLEAR